MPPAGRMQQGVFGTGTVQITHLDRFRTICHALADRPGSVPPVTLEQRLLRLRISVTTAIHAQSGLPRRDALPASSLGIITTTLLRPGREMRRFAQIKVKPLPR